MFVCHGKVAYGWKDKIKALDPESYATLRKSVFNRELPETQEGLDEFFKTNYTRDGAMDNDEVDAWNKVGVEVEVSRIKGLASNSRELAQTIYQVSVANIGLLQIQKVELLEDCCTFNLQDYLKAGWRILAVCPPNDTRRPTYIVGHFNQNEGNP